MRLIALLPYLPYLCGSALRCECAYFENVYGGCKIGLAKMSAIALTSSLLLGGFLTRSFHLLNSLTAHAAFG